MENLMLVVLCSLAVLIGGFGDRLRGGLFGNRIGWGTGLARLVAWSIPVALLTALAGLPLIYLVPMIIGLYLGCCAGQYDSLSMGHRGGKTGLQAWLGMSFWGTARLIIPAIIIGIFTQHVPWLIIVGFFSCPVLYYIAWYAPPKFYFKGFGYGDGPATGYDPSELGSYLHGIAMALVLVLSI